MAYFNKYFYDRSTLVKSVTYVNGTPSPAVNISVRSYEYGYADWSRVKPNPLNDTILRIYRHFENPTVIQKQQSASNLYVGPYKGAGDEIVVQTVDTPVTDATQKALSNFYNGQVNLAVFLGEARESSHMIVKKFGQITGLFSNLENLNFKSLGKQGVHIHPRKQKELKAIKRSKRVANAYLELKYGWLPLISDIYQMADAMRSSYKTVGTVVKSHGRSSSLNDYGVYSKVSLRGQVKNSATRSLAELGFANPLLIAWELVPFSFVIDYFLGIGNTLASFPLFTGTTFTSGTVTTARASITRSTRTGDVISQDTTITRNLLSLSQAQSNAVNFGLKNSLSISYSTASTLISLGLQRYR